MKRILECVPNFSEGQNPEVIKEITDAIESVDGIKLLDVDPGKATNRTVVTFVGEPEAVVEAAFRGIEKAAQVIDMSKHHGEHPRYGATDVCPLVPVSDISMEEATEFARKLAKRVGDELSIPVYCYENAAFVEERRSLANCRSGEYEGLKEKITSERWKPDFGPAVWSESIAKTGATTIGARNFLVAYNVNLNTTSTRRANAIAFDVREAGRVKREGDPVTGKIVTDENGHPVRIPGTLKKTRAIGWYIEEYGIAQISMNLTDISVTPVYVAFDEVRNKARERGLRVTGSELVGLIPLQAMLEAGKYFLRKQKRSTGISDEEIIKIAVKSMGLDELRPFNPKKKIIEYLIAEGSEKKLVNNTLEEFVQNTASESPAPGGGSVSAAVGAFGAALGTMVANLSAHKRGWDHRWDEFSVWAGKGKKYHQALLKCVDEDTEAFNKIMAAFGLPKSTEKEKAERREAIQQATKNAIEVPLEVMQLAHDSLEVMHTMAEIGNPNSVSDAGVGALCARTAVEGAYLNVKINASGCDDKKFLELVLQKAEKLASSARKKESEILKIVEGKI
ncbi:glutamate formiminotransferase / formiminotetrahydrofolate cyclodeaminase [Mariniphaga anaerophila]|uniref:Formimidoyltransferase-cyclodeaminase n=1 Tax=Mariniphaga anaerophila TaxID=1484053 RepID=A0A1M4T2M9_9BACT|nr:glutamate formimidoyltransferase [Mariniphaga anaerophila]SHE38648.1 glutamate formiminotransferase / formiminotetrahydrofolate cyclodeaminase [Mariniphaga anaerophila]